MGWGTFRELQQWGDFSLITTECVCVWGGARGGGGGGIAVNYSSEVGVGWGGETAVNYNTVCRGEGGGGERWATYRQLQQLGDFGSDNDIVVEV